MKMRNQIAGSMGSYLHFIELGWEPVLKGISNAGFKNVELSASAEWNSFIVVEELKSTDKKRLKDLLAKYNLKPICMSAHCNIVKKEGLEAFKKRMDFAAEMGVKTLITGTGKWNNGGDLDDLYNHVDKISKYAENDNLLITLETHGNGRSGMDETSSGQMYLPIIKHINKKNIKVCYDTANVIYYSNVMPEDDIKYIADYIGHLHIKDKKYTKGIWDFPALGQGNIKFDKIFDTLQTVGYKGALSVEVELTPLFTGEEALDVADFNKANFESYKFLKDYFSSL